MINRELRVKELISFDAPYRLCGSVAGMDEVGRGPLAGNVVTACVILPPEPPILWIDDSKKLSERRREKVYDEIIKTAEADIRELMNIPENYKVMFLQGGGHTQFAMVPLNLRRNGKLMAYTGEWSADFNDPVYWAPFIMLD